MSILPWLRERGRARAWGEGEGKMLGMGKFFQQKKRMTPKQQMQAEQMGELGTEQGAGNENL
jgi:hypothetical protein